MRKDIVLIVVLFAVAIPVAWLLVPGQETINQGNQSEKNFDLPEEISITSTVIGDKGPQQPYTITLKSTSTVERIPTTRKVMVYKTLPPAASAADILAYADRMGVKGPINEGPLAISIATDEIPGIGVTIIKASGCQEYYNGRINADTPKNLPTNEEAIKIATSFLKENGFRIKDLAPGLAKRPQTSTHYPNGTNTNQDACVEVTFKHTNMSNLPVYSAGVDVTIGENGEIKDIYSRMRNYKPYKEMAIRTPKEAFYSLASLGIRHDDKTSRTISSVSIDQISLGYQAEAGAFKEDYLKPVYILKGSSEGKDSKGKAVSEPVTEYIPALTDESIKELQR
jgi:hypothetical protein